MKRIVALAVFSFAILTFGFASISNIYAQLNWRTMAVAETRGLCLGMIYNIQGEVSSSASNRQR